MSTAIESAASPSGPIARSPGKAPPVLSRSWPLLGHLQELRRRPIELFARVQRECGEIGEMNFAGNRVVLLCGEAAQEAFFRATDEQLDQAAAYPFMAPIFGRGVLFDATPEQRKQGCATSLATRSCADTPRIAAETPLMMAGLGDEGELFFFNDTATTEIYTSSACLIGKEFREELTPEYFRVFYELEKGTDAIAYVNPDLPLPHFRRRDRARRRLVELLTGVFDAARDK
jgi:sterol 14-demethylase